MNQPNRKLSLILALTAGISAAGFALLAPAADLSVRAEIPPAVVDRVVVPTSSTSAAERRPESTSRPEVHNGFYHVPVGTRLVFAVHSDASTSIGGQSAAQVQRVQQVVDGKLELSVVARDDAELYVSGRFVDVEDAQRAVGGPRESADKPQADTLGEDLTHRFGVRMQSDGQILGYRFDDRAGAAARALTRSLLCGLVFVIPEGAGAKWECTEEDPSGSVLVAYRRLDAQTIERTKVRYLNPMDTERGLYAPDTSGSTKGRANAERGWMDGVVIRERYELDIDFGEAAIRVAGSLAAELELVHSALLSAAELHAIPFDHDAAWEPVHGGAEEVAAAERTDRRNLEARVGKIRLDELLQQLEQLLAADPVDIPAMMKARRNLIFKFQLDDGAVENVEALLLASRLSTNVAEIVLNALGAAQTGAAQSALAALISQPRLTDVQRVQGIQAMVQIDRPAQAVIDAVRSRVQSLSEASDVRRTAQLMLGAFASRTGRAALTDELVAQEPRGSVADLVNWLDALGNTGSAQAAAAALPFLGAEHETVRASAANAQQHGVDAKSLTAMVDRLAIEPSPTVRARIARALASRSGDGARRILADLMSRPDNDVVRFAIVERLASRGGDFARKLVALAAARDPNPRIQSVAKDVLSAHGRRG